MLKHEALHDSLTGLYNRRGFDKALAREIRRAERDNSPLAVIMFDIDGFKACNDTYGHAVGDNILKQLAQVASAQMRAGDVLARWGGEEFIVVLPGIDAEGAGVLGERIRSMVESARVDGPGRITVSVGVTAYRPGERLTDVCNRVDRAVYIVKERGRNAVEMI
ncbi:MAG: GGDEF domain-containing protein [Gammaproteobacteria bacterium]|nr:GGDEF domain-containing protein [Gammaproteobacteria bacterium]